MNDDFKILIGTQLDATDIPKQIKKVQDDLSSLNIKADLNKDSIDSIKKDLLSHTGELDKIGKQVGENIGKNITDGISNSVNGGFVVKIDKNANNMTNQIMNALGLKNNALKMQLRSQVKELITSFTTDLNSSLDTGVNPNILSDKTKGLAETLKQNLTEAQKQLVSKNGNIKAELDILEQNYAGFLQYFKSHPIKLTEGLTNELKSMDMYKDSINLRINEIKLMYKNAGSQLNGRWGEAVSSSNGILSGNTSNDKDQLIEVINALKDYKTRREQLLSQIKDKTITTDELLGIQSDSHDYTYSMLKTILEKFEEFKIKLEHEAKNIGTSIDNGINESLNNTNGLKGINEYLDQSINNVSSKKITIPFDISIDDRVNVQREIENFVDNITNAKGELVKFKTTTRTIFDEKEKLNVEQVTGAVATYKDELGQIITKTLSYGKIAEDVFKGKTFDVFGFKESSASYTTSLEDMQRKTTTFSDKIINSTSNATNKIEQLYSKVLDKNASKPIVDTNNIASLGKQYDKTIESINLLNTASKDTYAQMKADVESNISSFKSMASQMANAENIANELRARNYDTAKSTTVENLNKFINTVKSSNVPLSDMQKEIELLQTSLNGVGNTEDLKKFLNQFDIAKSKFDNLSSSYKLNNLISQTNHQISLMPSQLDVLDSKFNKLRNPSETLKNSVKELRTQFELVNNENDFDKKIQGYNNLRKSIELTTKQVQAMSVAERDTNNDKMFTSNKNNLLSNMSAYKSQNSKLFKSMSAEAKNLKDRFSILENQIQTCFNPQDIPNFRKQLSTLKNEVKSVGLEGFSTIDNIKNAMDKIKNWLGATTIIMAGVHSITQAYQEFKNIDTILTEISKTSNKTREELEALGDASFDSASEFGRKATDYLYAVQEMSRSGFYDEAGEEMARLSLILQSAGDLTTELANNFLLATNASYKYEGSIEKLNAVMDGANEITNRNSVSMQDMTSGMSKAGSVASNYGVKVNELSALVGTLVASTKMAGEEAGTSLKSLLINLNNINSSKITGQFDNLGISMYKIVDGAELLKTPIELLNELQQVYNNLPEGSADKASILTSLGGKWQADVCLYVQKCA